ncbi:MAG: tetratricopeptide repeat protein [Buchnera aphidicola (Brevicoryne brassicae)]|uniref:Tetratricopeptide repeat protein n=1 Tax=Buchnera aphidicola (Brevicoryne brassicae) TaxID=911343 RepID=A0AAJ5PUT2_9GAMM|nr:tetratricopeptide repeat protein [Buchnera aphidicola]QCI20139.1 tetratricopeptide repeat protein [Buchnera aphidicola (Brevicoryne brassicae)]WAI18960.1 MAG: tetratricopeptide repeat protein [Buchnera aphidicola (Brevicoryne brassicae)]
MIKKSKKYIIIFIIIFLILSIFLLFKKDFNASYQTNKKTLKYNEIKEKIKFEKFENLNKNKNIILKKNNFYETFNSMFLAKKLILNNDLDKAFIELSNCLKYTNEENLKNILKLRMVKIKIQKNEYELALNILKTMKNKNWINIIENIKGDIFVKQNKKKEALKCWKKSLSIELSNASKEIIKMKINELK